MRKRLGHWILSILSFCIALLSLTTTAEAAPIGMCSELGESIAAPPPLYAAKDTQMRGCDGEEFEGWDVPAPGRIPSGIDMPQHQVDKSFLVRDDLIIMSVHQTDALPPTFAESSAAEEHRGRLSRPPRNK